MMGAAPRKIAGPVVLPEVERFWAAAEDGKLLVKRCRTCGKTHFFPRAICPGCLGDDTEWVESSGKGKIYSYSTSYMGETVWTIAFVALDEGVTMMTNIVNCQPDAIKVGAPVRVVFQKADNDQSVPMFELG
jgi:uncharacterized OB-fold protein